MGMKLGFCKVVFCIAEFSCQSSKSLFQCSRIFLVLLSFQSSRFAKLQTCNRNLFFSFIVLLLHKENFR